MGMFPKITDEQKEEIGIYADCADELSVDEMSMKDLTPEFVEEARAVAVKYGFSWPPVLAWEDEVREAGFYGEG